MAAKKAAVKKAPAKKAAVKVTGECFAGDGPAVATVKVVWGPPRKVCERHASRARAQGQDVR
jgi:hypothetical protein